MEIERKYLISSVPFALSSYPCRKIEQGYLSTAPVVRLKDSLFIELDIFSGDLAPLMLAEVEFPDKETANHFTPPKWFGEDVTFSSSYHNSTLSKL